MKLYQPKIISSMKSYSGKQLVRDLIAGVIVAIIALPLSIALAIASGVTPEMGLYTAIVAGFIVALLGGSSVNITGPTAAFATIVAGIVLQHGIAGLALATLMAGVILILMGLFRFGSLIKFIPHTITTGFTAGIAVTIAIGDGGNELGMGAIVDSVCATAPLGELVCAREPADYTLVAGVSNWWGWGLAAALSLDTGRDLLPTDADELRRARLVMEAGAVDGVLGTPELMVDGLSMEQNLEILHALRTAAGL